MPTSGLGGMAFETLAREGAFCCVMDFCLQEFGNMLVGSLVSCGPDRLTNAGKSGTPQIVAPGALDLLDFAGWQEIPEQYADRPFHAHNRLIKSSVFNSEERRQWARDLVSRLEAASGPTHLLLPLQGIEAWDKEGEEAHDPEGLAAFLEETRQAASGRIGMSEVDAHINDDAFCEAALSLFDKWVQNGIVRRS